MKLFFSESTNRKYTLTLSVNISTWNLSQKVKKNRCVFGKCKLQTDLSFTAALKNPKIVRNCFCIFAVFLKKNLIRQCKE
jgi:hypothetical protein